MDFNVGRRGPSTLQHAMPPNFCLLPRHEYRPRSGNKSEGRPSQEERLFCLFACRQLRKLRNFRCCNNCRSMLVIPDFKTPSPVSLS